MNNETVLKLEEYRKKLLDLELFEERLSNPEYKYLEVQRYCEWLKKRTGSSINLNDLPEIRKYMICIIKQLIEEYKSKIEEL